MAGFNKAKSIKVLKGALIAGGGVIATYLLEAASKMDFGEWTPVIAGLCAISINFIRQVIRKEG